MRLQRSAQRSGDLVFMRANRHQASALDEDQGRGFAKAEDLGDAQEAGGLGLGVAGHGSARPASARATRSAIVSAMSPSSSTAHGNPAASSASKMARSLS